MGDGDHPQRSLVGRICNEVFTNRKEAQRQRREVRAPKALFGKLRQQPQPVEYLIHHPVGGVRAILRDISADFINIAVSLRVKCEALMRAGGAVLPSSP